MVSMKVLKVYLSLYTLLRSHLFVNCCIRRYSLYKIINGDRKTAQKEKRLLKGKQVAWMMYEHFKVSDTDESVLDLNEMSEVELENDHVLLSNKRPDETVLVMKKQPDEDSLEHVYHRQLQKSQQLKPLLSLYIQDTVQNGEFRDNTRVKKWRSGTSNGNFVRRISLLVGENLKSPPPGGVLFTPPVGDSRLLSAVTDIITINFAFNSCWDYTANE